MSSAQTTYVDNSKPLAIHTKHDAINSMATELQKRLARNIIENARAKRPKNKKELLVNTGYSEVTATAYPGVIIAQAGVQEYLKELGFHSDNAKRVVTQILHKEDAKDEVKLKAADMIFQVEGTYAPDKSVNMNVDSKQVADMMRDTMLRFRANN